jgi:hypothetical protein
LAEQERAFRRVDAQVVHEQHGDAPARLGTFDGAAQLSTQRRSASAGRSIPIERT